jgi:hypothetical protein
VRIAAVPEPILRTVGHAAAGAFNAVSRLRSSKSLHPSGAVYEATLRITGSAAAPSAAAILREPAEYAAIARFSRSIGLPRPLPDLFGVALRLTDVHGPGRHQDFLAVTSVDRPVLHHMFVPVRDPQDTVYSSSLPYRAGSERFLVGVLPRADSPRAGGPTPEEQIDRAAATGRLSFSLAVAPLSGRFRAVGKIEVGQRLPDGLERVRFNPWNSGGGLEPAGSLNALRAMPTRPHRRAGGDISQCYMHP